jgi:alanyl-tRNA synthetase
VSYTGEIGVVKILNAERHRGGVRLSVLCGLDAWEDYRRRQESVAAISALLSAKRDAVDGAVERLLTERDALKERVAALSLRLVESLAAEQAETEGNLCVFNPGLDEIASRELCNRLMERCGGLAAVFTGSDETGWRYIIGSQHADLRAHAREINKALQGRGGGRPEMIQGQAAAPESAIRAFWESVRLT